MAYEYLWLSKQLGYRNAEAAINKTGEKLTTQQIHIAIGNDNRFLKEYGLSPVRY
ncbi:MAG: hypothetical protein JW739_05830 [Opitutales bacterium]|nr:hypothetical protein [Opitutales bacterium]